MRKLVALLVCLCSLLNSAVRAPAQETAAQSSTQPALTIYNQNFFVAREYLPMQLTSGINRVQFTGMTSLLEPDSVILRDPNGRSLQILEQNYRNDPVSQELLLSLFEGKTLDFLMQRGEKTEFLKGKIIRSGYAPPVIYNPYNGSYPQPGASQPIIEVDGVLRFGLPGQPLFPALAGDTILKPTLSWLLNTDRPGNFDAELSYVSGGMNWQADYNLVVSDVKARTSVNSVDLVGWVTMRNQSGKTYENARIKLMAGDVSKIEGTTMGARMYNAVAKAAMEDRDQVPVVREKSFDEFHLYTLERSTTLHDQETKQVEFVQANGIRAQRTLHLRRRESGSVRLLQPGADPPGPELRHGFQSQGLGDAGVQKLRDQPFRHAVAQRPPALLPP